MAPTQYYVDPAIAGNSGAGTIGDPYGDLQWALDHITRDATNGDQINIKAGTAELLAAKITWTTYGNGGAGPTAPLIIRGYTSAANDGGVGVIDGQGGIILDNTSLNYVYWIDLKFQNVDSGSVLAMRANARIMYARCEFTDLDSSAYGLMIGSESVVIGCYFHDCLCGQIVEVGGTDWILHNYFNDDGVGPANQKMIRINNSYATVIGNAIVLTDTDAKYGIYQESGNLCTIANNSIFRGGSGLGAGIRLIGDQCLLFNNVVEGFSGAGGKGIDYNSRKLAFAGANAAYNNATNFTALETGFSPGADDATASSPFVAGATGDLDINGTVVGVTEDAWPLAFLGATSTNPKAEKGAVQSGAGSGGGGAVSISPFRGNF